MVIYLYLQASLLQIIEDSGFDGKLLGSGDAATLTLVADGMASPACSTAIEATLSALPGVLEAAANSVSGKIDVKYDPERTGPRAFISAISSAGFEARPAPQDAGVDGSLLREKERRFWRRKFLLSLVFSVPLFLINSECCVSGHVLSFAVRCPLSWRHEVFIHSAL